MGVHGCVYTEPPGGGLVFAASADAVLAHPAVEGRLSPQGLFNYFVLFVSPAPDMVFAGQRKLLAGQRLVYRNGRTTIDHYWRMPYAVNGARPVGALADELRETFGQAIGRSLLGEDPATVGAFLSGGLDSTTVCAYLGSQTNTQPRCFTTGFNEDGYDETPFAEIGARHVNADHCVHRLSATDALEFLPVVAAAYDEPFGNSSAIPAYYCAREAASRGIRVMLAGDGGDELFAGNKSYVEQLRYEAVAAIPRAVRTPMSGLLAMTGGLGQAVPLLRRARNALSRADVALPERLRIFNLFHQTAPDSIFTPEFLSDVDVDRPAALLRAHYTAPETPHALQRMMHADLQLILADNDLRKVVRMCELAGVRVKFPMLDDGLVDFAASVPPTVMMEGRSIRSFYKEAMSPVLPRAILDKEKHGFGMPFDLWIQEDKALNAVACDALRAIGKRGIFRAEPIKQTANELEKGRSGPLRPIAWDIMMCELWLQSRSLDGV
jgi:asparagine synthase (glutamine-hydrolysing)